MSNEMILPTNILQPRKTNLSDNSSQFPARCAYSVRCTSVACRERLTRYDKCGYVGPEVLEEVCYAVEEYEGFF